METSVIGVMEQWSNGVMELRFLPTLHYSNSPLFQRGSFLLVPLQHDVLHHSADYSVILNEVKDLTIEI